MATIEIAGLRPDEVPLFLDTLDKAVACLDDLAQLQAVCGTVGMQHRASKTENIKATLENFVRQIHYTQGLVNR